MPLVYLAVNKINGKRYVGFTRRTLKRRIQGHFSSARIGRKQSVFWRAIRKHGEGAFDFTVIAEFDTVEEGIVAEAKYIADLKPEYNMSAGGITPTGLPWTEERSLRHSEYMKKMWRDRPWLREEQSKRLRGKKRPDNLLIAKNSDHSSHSKSVVCLNDGGFFKSIKDAARHYKIGYENMHTMLRRTHGTCNGLSFVLSDGLLSDQECLSYLTRFENIEREWNARRGQAKSQAVICETDGKSYPNMISAIKEYGLTPHVMRVLCSGKKSRCSNLKFRFVE